MGDKQARSATTAVGSADSGATRPLAEEQRSPPLASRDLAAEFARLRGVQGYFQGGRWTADVDDWMGRKHQVMIKLGSQLGRRGCPRARVTDLLGPPDLMVGPGEAVLDQIGRQAGIKKPPGEAYKLLIYYWRGTHDFLYFASAGGIILGSGWWHAHE